MSKLCQILKLLIAIITITETQNNRTCMIKMEHGIIFIYSGVLINKRVAAGVGCLINNNLVDKI